MVVVTAAALLAGVIIFGSQVVGNDSTSPSAGSDDPSNAGSQSTSNASGRPGAIADPSFAAEVDADPSGRLAWRQSRLDDIPAGDVLLALRNDSTVPHNIAIEGSDGRIIVGPSTTVAEATASVTVRLAPGTYRYICTVPGHREAGMDGTLNVVAIGR
jgi:plastocyanin